MDYTIADKIGLLERAIELATEAFDVAQDALGYNDAAAGSLESPIKILKASLEELMDEEKDEEVAVRDQFFNSSKE